MTQQDRQLLLKDLCARLPYDVFVRWRGANVLLTSVMLEPYINEECKPYLRPMSSMTTEEKEKYDSHRKHLCDEYNCYCFDTIESIDWLTAHHFDYRTLIDKGLALEAPAEMYI